MKHFINSKIQSIVTGIEKLIRLRDNVWVNCKQGDLVYIESLSLENQFSRVLCGKEMNEFFLFTCPLLDTPSSHYKNPYSFRSITLGEKLDFDTILLEGWAYNRYKGVWVWQKYLVTENWRLSFDSVNLLEYRELTEVEYLQIREDLLLNQAGENFEETKTLNYEYEYE